MKAGETKSTLSQFHQMRGLDLRPVRLGIGIAHVIHKEDDGIGGLKRVGCRRAEGGQAEGPKKDKTGHDGCGKLLLGGQLDGFE